MNLLFANFKMNIFLDLYVSSDYNHGFSSSKSIYGHLIAIFHFWSQLSKKSARNLKWSYVSAVDGQKLLKFVFMIFDMK